MFDGLAAAVVGTVLAAAMLSIGGRALRGRTALIVAAFAFLTIFVVGVPFPLVVLAAAGTGLVLGPERLGVTFDEDRTPRRPLYPPTAAPAAPDRARAGRRARRMVGPPPRVVALTGTGSIYSEEARSSRRPRSISFGGAYAVLAYVGTRSVRRFALSPRRRGGRARAR